MNGRRLAPDFWLQAREGEAGLFPAPQPRMVRFGEPLPEGRCSALGCPNEVLQEPIFSGDFLLVLPVKKEKKRAPQALAGGRKGTGKG